MTNKTKTSLTIIFCLIFFLTLALPVLAVSWFPSGSLVPAGCQKDTTIRNCGLNEVFQMIINFSQLILAITGSMALLMFTYGGVLWIIAAGNQERIQKGKAALAAATLGLVIILGSWLIVNTTICALTKGDVGCDAKIFGSQDWFQSPTGEGGVSGDSH